jgi:hypothetical protein
MVLRGASSSRVLLPVVSPRKVVPQKDHRSLNPKLQVQKTLKQTERRPLRGPSTVRPLIKKSNSRSLVAETVLPTPRKKPKAKRSVQSLKLPENVGKRAQSNQMTILESKSVSTEVLWQYGGYLKKFEAFLRANDVKVPLDAAEADAVLADYMDVLFLDKRSPSEGEKTLAALEFFRYDLKGLLMRSRRALKGWRKTMPARSRLPIPKLLMFGIAMRLFYKGFKDMALKVLTDFDLYLRPGEGLALKAKNILPPVMVAGAQFKMTTVVIRDFESGVPDKVGVYDSALRLDNRETCWIGEFLLQLSRKQKNQEDRIFQFTMEEFRKQFMDAGKALGVEGLHPYQLRHGGASQDLSSGLRDHNGVKSRGRWRTDQSVRRYAKIGRVQQLLTKLSHNTLQYCQWSGANMEKVFRGIVPARGM